MLNPYSKFHSFMLKGFKDMLTCMHHFSSALVQCFTSLAQAVTSQTESREPLKSALIVIMPEYLFEINCFGITLVHLTEEKYNIYDKLGFGNSACDITGSFPSPLTR